MDRAMPKSCAVCGKPAAERYRPFCSARCADVDLGRWLGESYRVATPEAPDDPVRLPTGQDGED